ncbi:MAG: glutamate-5-semialdehyde dehydrogenase [Clostridia bacterium]|nr:glutamate-5-semialdehyde dehydrogenase [Clostridia bacterium]
MLNEIGARAKKASRVLATAGTDTKNKALVAIADALMARAEYIIEANKRDIKAARINGMSEAMVDRLALDIRRIEAMARGAFEVSQASDPIGKVLSGTTRPNGLKIEKVTVPLGVIAVIYESRPNVTADAAALCLKSGNAVILRGGKEAIYSNIAIAHTMREAVESVGLPADCIQLIENTSRESASQLMKLNEYVDVLIPRGGAGLIKACVENSTVPVIETGTGNCHVYVDKDANIDIARDIIVNAKTSRPSVCNACESLLFHRDVDERAVFALCKALDDKGVRIHSDQKVKKIIPSAVEATEEDWGTEYLGYEISAKFVENIDEAIEHITKYGTGHSECIVTDNYFAANKFTSEVDAAAVYVNASTRFTDGSEFGFGAEIGISTQKLHARGPLGLDNLTSEKYIVTGNGQIR